MNKQQMDDLGNYMIYGNINGKRGGAFFGHYEDDTPVFGGGNLMHAPIWWNTTLPEVQLICDEIMRLYPNCTATPKKVG